MLKVINLKVGHSSVASIHLMALGNHLLRKIVGPIVLVFFYLPEGSSKVGIVALVFAIPQKSQKA